MHKLFTPPGRRERPRYLLGRTPTPRRLLTAPLAGLVAAAVLLVAPALATADTSSSLTVVGTSDASDSGLIPNLIQPAFQKAYPQFTFKYIGTATGTAISDAESGSVGASALMVHAPSLENQFVANGFSYRNQYGNALFINDFVLGGSTTDPAGAAANGAHNIVQSFADVARAGIGGKATFVSRGGTPGTTVKEHEVWQMVASSGLSPAGLLLCAVNSKNGGGYTPIAAGHGVTAAGQACPNAGALPTGVALPAWYAATGLTQGPNVQAANACNGYPSGASSCYVLTDRGTYDYLSSGTDPAGAIPGLKILSRDNSASAPGGAYDLINYFHGYIINPSQPNQTVNLTAARDFLNLLTSPTIQAQIATYLARTSDPGGAPFKPTASPTITLTKKLPKTYKAAKKWTVAGTVTNAQPGYPVLAGKTVSISKVVGGLPIVPVASGKTDGQGGFSISYVPPTTGAYEVTTPQISQIENATLNPQFGDLLSPGATSSVKVTVHSAITQLTARSQGGQALVLGSVSPATGHVKAEVTILARPSGSKRGYRRLATDRLGASDGNFAVGVRLAAGRWQIQARYQDPRQVVGAPARTVTVTVGAKPTASVGFTSVKVKNGALTVSGAIKPAASRSGAKVQLLAMKTADGPPRFGEKAKVTVRSAKTRFTVRFTLKRGYRWVLRLVNVQTGRATSDSNLRTVNVR